MKKYVLSLLKEHYPDFVSGELICKSLGVSRTSIWKHIQSLRADGYKILAQPHLGYKLLEIPDRLYPQEIVQNLSTRFIGQQIFYYEQAVSTNKIAQGLATKPVPDGSLVVAEEQTGGRGRLGRGWFSPYSKGLWFSLILYPPVNPIDTPPLTMLVAVAVARAVQQNTGLNVGIKWPNDLLIKGKKVCGILVELNAEMERVNYIIIGIGLNVNIDSEEFPEEIRKTATSLKIHAGRPVWRVLLLQQILTEIENLYLTWLKEGFLPILPLWKNLCVTLHCPVSLSHMNESISGWAEDIDESGALLVRLPDGQLYRAVAGELSLRTQT